MPGYCHFYVACVCFLYKLFIYNIVYRNKWLGNTIIIFAIYHMLNIGQMDNAVLLDIWWNMLIKFSKHIVNSFAKIIAAKPN